MNAGAQASARARALSRIVHTAAFLVERAEEGGPRGRGDSTPLAWMAPAGWSPGQARAFQHAVIQPARLSIVDAALALRRQLEIEGSVSTADLPSGAEVRDAASPIERAFLPVAAEDIARRLDRAIVRGVRYIWQVHAIGACQDSRVFEQFVPDALIPRGRSMAAANAVKVWREHVVPCCELLLRVRHAFEAMGAPASALAPPARVRELADAVRSLLVIVEVTEREAGALDAGPGAADLKWKMPSGWDAARSCVFQRLHTAGIAFEMLPDSLSRHPSMRCRCGFGAADAAGA